MLPVYEPPLSEIAPLARRVSVVVTLAMPRVPVAPIVPPAMSLPEARSKLASVKTEKAHRETGGASLAQRGATSSVQVESQAAGSLSSQQPASAAQMVVTQASQSSARPAPSSHRPWAQLSISGRSPSPPVVPP